ncbi:hypothetical protein NC651_008955 [Populus alba x Populus x berolinensis]|nr:hypothetical protein NC651_008955 [Populus alba x Populus x berolinensis]
MVLAGKGSWFHDPELESFDLLIYIDIRGLWYRNEPHCMSDFKVAPKSESSLAIAGSSIRF